MSGASTICPTFRRNTDKDEKVIDYMKLYTTSWEQLSRQSPCPAEEPIGSGSKGKAKA